MVKRDHLFWHHICNKNGIKHAWGLYKKGRRSALAQLGRCAYTAFWMCWRYCKRENFRHHCYLYNNDYRLNCRAKDPTIGLDSHGPHPPKQFQKKSNWFSKMHIDPRSIYNFEVHITNLMCIAPEKAHGLTICVHQGSFQRGLRTCHAIEKRWYR